MTNIADRIRLTPVIFANGEDDDLPGLQAFARNEAVQYRDKVYEPDETVAVVGHLNLSCHGVLFSAEGMPRIVAFGSMSGEVAKIHLGDGPRTFCWSGPISFFGRPWGGDPCIL